MNNLIKQKTFWIFLAIILLAAFLRLYQLGIFPVGVTADEIQQGYTGYSILKTGRDEWGDFLPLNPRGFGDYKPPLFSYLTIPFEIVWGLTIFAVRLPSALAGIATIIVIYFLAKKIFEKQSVALLASFILATSYWHIYYSRFAWESNVGLLLFAAGILSFLHAFKRPKLFVISALLFGLSLFTYHSFKVQSILLLFTIIFFYRDQFKKLPRNWLFFGLGVWCVFLGITVYSFVFAGGGRRASDVAIYQEENLADLRNAQVTDGLPQPFNRILYSKPDFVIGRFIQNYVAYFSTVFYNSPNRSDSSLFNMPGIWLIPFWETVFFGLGLFWLINKRKKWMGLVLAWMVIAPIPAALAKEYMQTQRVEALLLLFPLLSAFGIVQTYIWIKNTKIRWLLVAVLTLMVIWGGIKDADFYLFHQFTHPLGGLKYGYDQVVTYVNKHQDQYDHIIFTKSHSEPQIFPAFYTQMDPRYYQQQSRNWKHFEKDGYAFLDEINYSLGKYEFRNVVWNKDYWLKNTLLVANPDEVLDSSPKKFEAKDPQGKTMFVVIDTNDVH